MLKKKKNWNRLAVILVNFNGKKFLKETISSLMQKAEEEIEILVVDNGSKDDSMEYVETYCSSVHTEYIGTNIGWGAGCNVGMRIAFECGAKFVLLLNTDTEIERGMISELLRYCNDNTVTIPRIYKDKEGSLWYSGGRINFATAEVEQTLFKYDKEDAEHDLPRQVEFATGCCMMINKVVWQKVGGFAEEYFLYYEDVDYCMRLKELGVNILYIPKAAMWHKVGGSAGGEISATSLYYTVRNRLVFAEKYRQYLKYDVMEVLKIIMEYFTSPYNFKYEAIVLSAIKDYMKGVRGKEKNHIHDNYTIISGFFDIEEENGDWWHWCGSPKAVIEIYNSEGEKKTQEIWLSFTIMPAPLKENVNLVVIDEATGDSNVLKVGLNQLKIHLKPYEKKMLIFCSDEKPVVGFNGDARNLLYQIRNVQLKKL